jgi:hypothetical protein
MIGAVVIAGAIALALCPAPAAAQMLDRVLATVDGQILTLSDVRAALKFGIVPADVSEDPIQSALRRLIDRRLMLAEIERYAPPEPLPIAVDAALAAVQARFKDSSAFEAALSQSATSREELRRHIRDSLRLDAYMQQRFFSIPEPSDDEIARYYKEHASEFTANGVLRPLSEVRGQVVARVAEAKREVVAGDWLQGLRRRSAVVILYLPGR